jgi:DMSO/TMAO reductase YedYZ molybdopterin-dependent catalytic subunit
MWKNLPRPTTLCSQLQAKQKLAAKFANEHELKGKKMIRVFRVDSRLLVLILGSSAEIWGDVSPRLRGKSHVSRFKIGDMHDDSIFSGNERKEKEQEMLRSGRLPPGQSLTLKWPVLHYGSVPRFDPARWDFRIRGLVEQPVRLIWEEFNKLPQVKTHSDFHCVTRWSRFDNDWQGVAFQDVLKLVKLKPEAKYVLVHAEQGFTANVPLADLDRDDVLFATHHDGQPLTADHGYPLRLIVPHLYAWKSVKWVRGLEFTEKDVPGFWEQNGYHMYGDPFLEQRFDTD